MVGRKPASETHGHPHQVDRITSQNLIYLSKYIEITLVQNGPDIRTKCNRISYLPWMTAAGRNMNCWENTTVTLLSYSRDLCDTTPATQYQSQQNNHHFPVAKFPCNNEETTMDFMPIR